MLLRMGESLPLQIGGLIGVVVARRKLAAVPPMGEFAALTEQRARWVARSLQL
jgi:hypothetical protein